MLNATNFDKFFSLSNLLNNLFCFFASEELAALYDEKTLLSFFHACNVREERATNALASCFPGGMEELLNTPTDKYNDVDHTYSEESLKWMNTGIHIMKAVMICRRARKMECDQMMSL